MTHICVGKLTIIDSDNGLSTGRSQAIIWTKAGILLIGPLGIYFNEILIGVKENAFENAFENVVCEMASILSRPQCVNMIYAIGWGTFLDLRNLILRERYTKLICNTLFYEINTLQALLLDRHNHVTIYVDTYILLANILVIHFWHMYI